jgi:hypothetical protein
MRSVRARPCSDCASNILVDRAAAVLPNLERSVRRGRIKQPPVRNVLQRLWPGQNASLASLDDLMRRFYNTQ